MAPAALLTDRDAQFIADNEGLIRCIVQSFRRTYLLKEHEVEDFLQIGRIRLLRIPIQHRDNYNFVKVALKNALVDGWRRMHTRRREIAAGLFREELDEETQQAHPMKEPAQPPTIQAELEQEERDEQLHAALDALPDTERTVLRMWVGIAGPRHSVREIARILGHGQDWTKKRQVAGLHRLAIALEPHFAPESQKTLSADCSITVNG